MKINRALADQYKTRDLLGLDEEKYRLEMCPTSIRKIAENILSLIESTYLNLIILCLILINSLYMPTGLK
jgi:hypothetical protein